jgi:preprotein translocase subunit YajC
MDAASLLLPILLIAVFYLLLIRPQQKQRRKMMELQQSLQPGAKVMTGAGLLATVVAIEGDEVVLEVAPGVHNRYVRRAIVNIVPPEQSADQVAEPTAASEAEQRTETIDEQPAETIDERPDGGTR